jgi:hypothetical protein
MDSQDIDRDVTGEETDAPRAQRTGGPAGTSARDVEQKPIGEWVDDDDTDGFGAEQPPGG